MAEEKGGARALPAQEQPSAAPAVAVGDIVLLHAENQQPSPAIVLSVGQDGALNVNDLSGQFGRLYGVLPQEEQSDPLVLSWTAR